MGKRKTNFYDTYDELFIKPKSIKQTPKTTNHSKSAKKKSTLKSSHKAVYAILIALFLIYSFGKLSNVLVKGNESTVSEDAYGDDEDYTEAYPLKEAKIQQTGKMDLTVPLSLTLLDHTFQLNNGYQLEVKGDSDIEQSGEMSVLPTKDSYPLEQTIADISFYSGREFTSSCSIGISANLVNSMEYYFEDTKASFVQVYPQSDIDAIKTGYVVNYEVDDEEYVYAQISKYYVFSDGTGLWIDTYSNDDEEKNLDSSSKYTTVRKAYQSDFDFIDQNFIFSKKQ